MVTKNNLGVRIIGAAAIALVAHVSHPNSSLAQSNSKVDIKGKVVLANVDRFPADFRVGSVTKQIAPKKASLLSPKRFPVTIEIWNGVKSRAAWERQSIPAAGIYTFRFQNGRWTLSKHRSRGATGRTRIATASRRTYRGTTGSARRVIRGRGRVYYGGRIPLLRRVAGDVLWLHRFVRDEEDRDLLRDIVIGREIDRELEREILDKLDDIAVNLPAYERGEFERALDDLNNLNEKDLKDLEGATEEEWGQVRDAFGDQVTDDAWRDLESDFGDIEVDDLSEQDVADLGEAGIDSLDSDIDIGDLDGGDVDIGDLGGTLDNIDIGDLGGGIDNIDAGDMGGDFGGDVGGDMGGGFDGGFDGGGFDYDAGGFDDFGGGFDDGGGGFDDFGDGFDDF
jgi:hypothetical protein